MCISDRDFLINSLEVALGRLIKRRILEPKYQIVREAQLRKLLQISEDERPGTIDAVERESQSSANLARLEEVNFVRQLQAIINNVQARQWLFEQVLRYEQRRCSNSDLSNPASDLTVAIMKFSRSIWLGGSISPEIYSEALSRTWEWFIAGEEKKYPKQVMSTCADSPRKKSGLLAYDPLKASFTTWFNNKLKYTILSITSSPSPTTLPIDDSSTLPVEPNRWLETVEQWLEFVTNSRELRNERMHRHPHVNCQNLLIALLTELKNTGEFSWSIPAYGDDVSAESLKRFCKGRCFSCFKRNLPDYSQVL